MGQNELPAPRPDIARKDSQTSTRSSISEMHDLSQMHHHHLPSQHHHHLPPANSPSQMHFAQQDVNGMHMQMDAHRGSYSHPSQNGILNPPNVLPQLNGHLSNGVATSRANGYDNGFVMLSPHQQTHSMTLPSSAGSPLSGLLGPAPEETGPSWLFQSPPAHISSSANLRYPVLLPLLSHIQNIIPTNLACDLLDLYFTCPSTAFFQPASPYVLTHIFRKRSFLHPTSPRVTSPALLCAMLWVAAQTSDAPFFTSPPTTRGRVCQKLLELCIHLLKPLVHANMGTPTMSATAADGEPAGVGVGLGGLSGMPGSGREGVGAAGTLDDVLTYIHLGTVISASEFKAASLRWFHTAWTLARELRLNREVPMDLDIARQEEEQGHPSPTDGAPQRDPTGMSEEEREERRRTWWLLYIIDRHLALCYNRPLALLDVECESLYLPLPDSVWQSGEFMQENGNGMFQGTVNRATGPVFEISGPGLFEFFLPLMMILGMIVDLHHARNRPRFMSMGSNGQGIEFWDDVTSEITGHLDTYAASLKAYEQANTPQSGNGESNENPATPGSTNGTANQEANGHSNNAEADMQTKIVVSYGTHVMHVLYILLQGKWDPISMLDDNDLWISSNSFLSATAHAVSAAEAINNILKYDPDLSFMPYFFGIYLLQGSFLLLLIADKLQGEASQAVVTACETIVRAHEVCVVTLNTEYQVCSFSANFLELLLTTATAQLPQSHAFSTQPSTRPRPTRRHGRAEAQETRSFGTLPMVRGWNGVGVVACPFPSQSILHYLHFLRAISIAFFSRVSYLMISGGRLVVYLLACSKKETGLCIICITESGLGYCF